MTREQLASINGAWSNLWIKPWREADDIVIPCSTQTARVTEQLEIKIPSNMIKHSNQHTN